MKNKTFLNFICGLILINLFTFNDLAFALPDQVENLIIENGPFCKFNQPVKICCAINNPKDSFEYKFDWRRINQDNDWSESGTIKEYDSKNEVIWIPPREGSYMVYCHIKDSKNQILTKTSIIKVENSQSMVLKGIDISYCQQQINWGKVKDSGIKFVLIRDGYGREFNQVDSMFERHFSGATSVGLDIGVYHFSYATSIEDAEREADVCLSIIKNRKFTYPVIFDIEDESIKYNPSIDKRLLTDICKTFCRKIRANGYYPMIYTCLYWTESKLFADELFQEFDLWLAHYASSPGRDCCIWQSTNEGTVDGIVGNVDLDFSHRDYPTIIKNLHCNGF